MPRRFFLCTATPPSEPNPIKDLQGPVADVGFELERLKSTQRRPPQARSGYLEAAAGAELRYKCVGADSELAQGGADRYSGATEIVSRAQGYLRNLGAFA